MYYEFLWNLRKKKTVGLLTIVFILASLLIFLPPLLSNALGEPFQQNPSFVFTSAGSGPGIVIFLLAVATTMNTISGEFESGTIIPLLTKPVSRNLIFAGKLLASFLSLLVMYVALNIYLIVGGILVYGPQDNLGLIPLGVLGITIATMVWASIVVTLGTLSKNSLVAALGSFGFFIGLTIAGMILGAYLGQTSLLFYAPGEGATGSTGSCIPGALGAKFNLFATGTNGLGLLLMQWALNPDLVLNFCGFRFASHAPSGTETFQLSADPVSTVALRALGVSLSYIIILLVLSWVAFKRAQVTE